jgi:curved DNA-binding protein CbpA
MDDLYQKLQVDPRAETEVIRAAYYALARKYHPDAGGDAQRMVEFNAAWAVLGNKRLRSAYDSERNQPSTPPVTAERPDPGAFSGRGRSEAPPRSKHDSSSSLDFGRYAGWSLEQLVKSDPDYLQWLVRTSIGRRLSAEVKELLEVRDASLSAVGVGRSGPRTGGPVGARPERGPARRQWFGRTRHGR